MLLAILLIWPVVATLASDGGVPAGEPRPMDTMADEPIPRARRQPTTGIAQIDRCRQEAAEARRKMQRSGKAVKQLARAVEAAPANPHIRLCAGLQRQR